MHLFKTEMLFLHPPRTRFAYGRRAPCLPRYGRRALPRTDAAPVDPPAHSETLPSATATALVVERAA